MVSAIFGLVLGTVLKLVEVVEKVRYFSYSYQIPLTASSICRSFFCNFNICADISTSSTESLAWIYFAAVILGSPYPVAMSKILFPSLTFASSTRYSLNRFFRYAKMAKSAE